METIRAHAFVSGMVQGVFFRSSLTEYAHTIVDLTGWTKNLPDGRVEVLCEGPTESVNQLIKWLHHGPPTAKVDSVEITYHPTTGEFSDFTIHHYA